MKSHPIGYTINMVFVLPSPVGPLSERATSLLATGTPITAPIGAMSGSTIGAQSVDPLQHDLQLALYVLNELHYGGWTGVDDDLEWDPNVTSLRRALDSEFEQRLRRALVSTPSDTLDEARRLLAPGAGPSVSGFLRESGTADQVRESMILRTPYQGKEADPHTFALPRFNGPTKRVFTEIQAGEYGVGHRRSHAELFADSLEGLGLDPTVNAYIDQCSGAALATSNLVTLGAMNRRLRGVVLGQLSFFEMDSVVPNQRMVDCCDRLELDDKVRPFFHIHVMADAEHQLMVESAFLTDYPTIEPDQVDNVLLGMRAQALIDHAIAAQAVPAWENGESALVGRLTGIDLISS